MRRLTSMQSLFCGTAFVSVDPETCQAVCVDVSFVVLGTLSRNATHGHRSFAAFGERVMHTGVLTPIEEFWLVIERLKCGFNRLAIDGVSFVISLVEPPKVAGHLEPSRRASVVWQRLEEVVSGCGLSSNDTDSEMESQKPCVTGDAPLHTSTSQIGHTEATSCPFQGLWCRRCAHRFLCASSLRKEV